MKKTLAMMLVAVVASGAAIVAAQTSEAQATSAAMTTGLTDLEKLTFGCPKAALNAAARRAADVPSQGTYQFTYFNIVSDSHHAVYEVHFRSNYEGESLLKYCVEIYCQQGWDPKTAKTTVTLMSHAPQRAADVHGAGSSCSEMHMPASPRSSRRRPSSK